MESSVRCLFRDLTFVVCVILGNLAAAESVVVVAANPRGVQTVQADRGTRTNLTCPSHNGLPASGTVSWYSGNSTSQAVQLSEEVMVSAQGQLVFLSTSQADAGWYTCQYQLSGQTVQGQINLRVIDVYIDMYVVNPGDLTTQYHPGVQNTARSVPSNKMIIFHAGTTEQDDIQQRNAVWLYKGGNTELRRPFFCYSGYVTGEQGTRELRMALLASYWNYSGVYEIQADHLRTSVTLTISDDGNPVMFPNGFQESFVNCDSAFQPRVVTPPTTTPPRTTTPTTSPTTAPTTQTTSRPPTPNERTTSEQMPAETTAETHTTTRMIGMIVVKDSSALIPGIAAGAAALCVAFIALLACGLRQRNRNSSTGKNTDPESKLPTSSGSKTNNQMDDVTGKLDELVQAKTASDRCNLPPTMSTFQYPPAAAVSHSPTHIQNDTHTLALDRQSPPSLLSRGGYEANILQRSTDSLDGYSVQTEDTARPRTQSQTTMISSMTMPYSVDTGSLSERYDLPTSSGQSPNLSMRPEYSSTPKNGPLSCPMHRRCNSFNSTSSLLQRSESPTPSAANIVMSSEGSPAFIQARTSRSGSLVSSRSHVVYQPSPLVNSPQPSSRPSSARASIDCRSSANIVTTTPRQQRRASPRSEGNLHTETLCPVNIVVESCA